MNGCRSIGISDVLLISPNYFATGNANFLISGLIHFFNQIINLYLIFASLIL